MYYIVSELDTQEDMQGQQLKIDVWSAGYILRNH